MNWRQVRKGGGGLEMGAHAFHTFLIGHFRLCLSQSEASCKTFHFERLRTKPRFEKEVQDNSEVA